MRERKNLFSQDTFVSGGDDDLVIREAATIRCGLKPLLEAHGKSKVLSRKSIGIGRDKHNGVIVADPLVSKFHAIITFRKGEAFIKDTGSTNGTFVNDQRLPTNRTQLLKDQDLVVVGTTRLTIRY
ncbi:FHA domain-containing protein [Alkalispirochaeta americana]|uniref:FHA domain-containing protein n=1 Tax=Alkalispirochaeta americana TaxID=159291 RepID=A0A1N6NKT4_9SPIO|nr:FHA domain-containing protein [Alkalispirochaeta americana]SIP92684.1 FHA domain-containing protein [Alkalispirochaeta americana]